MRKRQCPPKSYALLRTMGQECDRAGRALYLAGKGQKSRAHRKNRKRRRNLAARTARALQDWRDFCRAKGYDTLAEQAAGNWLHFESFAWHARPHDCENWCLVYTSNRDSRLLEESNATAIAQIMAPYCDGWGTWDLEDPDCVEESHSHWAVGHVDGFALRVYQDDGTGGKVITRAFTQWCRIQEMLEDYPVLDDDDYSQREYEATLSNISDCAHRYTRDDLPDDWVQQCHDWLWQHGNALENRDDQGGYPTSLEMLECLRALGFTEPEEKTEPEEGDYVTSDYRHWRRVEDAHWFLYLGEEDDWRRALKVVMSEDRFWPNCWYQDDHGGWLLLSLEPQ